MSLKKIEFNMVYDWLSREDEEYMKESSSQPVEDEFNSFLYWREPLPDIDCDLTLSSPAPETKDIVESVSGFLPSNKVFIIVLACIVIFTTESC